MFDVECIALNDAGNEFIKIDFVEKFVDVSVIMFEFCVSLLQIFISQYSSENNIDDELYDLIFLYISIPL